MNALIAHFLANDTPCILRHSSRNCHVQGLHSVMFREHNGFGLRLYVVTDDHLIWRNQRHGIPSTPMISGFHPHHSNLMLHCVHGEIVNKRAGLLVGHNHQEDEYTQKLRRYKFDKSVEDKEIETGFVFEGFDYVRSISDITLTAGSFLSMTSKDMHTIYVDRNQTAAWFVYNGQPDPDYVPLLWSNAELHKIDNDQLYLPMSDNELVSLLAIAKLLPA